MLFGPFRLTSECGFPWWRWVYCGRRLLWWLVACTVVWFLGLNGWFDLALFFLLLVAAVVGRPSQLVALSVSLACTVAVLEVAVRRIPKSANAGGFYRPLEMLIRYTGSDSQNDPPLPRFEPNTEVRMKMPYGDLLALEPNAPRSIIEPRTVYLKSDRLGMRNDADYAGEKWLLLGDSLVACTSNDQKACLANVLRKNHGLATYSLAFPSEPDFYVARLEWALRKLPVPPDVRALAFVFEGNDFRPEVPAAMREPITPTWYDQRKLEAIELVRPRLVMTEYLFRVTRQLERMVFPRSEDIVETYRVGKHFMGFLGTHIDNARCQALKLDMIPTHPPELLRKIAAVFFVPTSYRTYAPHIKDGRPPLPEPAPAFLAAQKVFSPLGIQVIDLTPAMRRRADELLVEGKYVYHRDDTHWNMAGVEAAAKMVVEALRYLPSAPRPTAATAPSAMPPSPHPASTSSAAPSASLPGSANTTAPSPTPSPSS